MNTDTAENACALTEAQAQALLILVAVKLKANALAPHELFSMYVTVQLALRRFENCYDELFTTQHLPLTARAPGVAQ